MANKSINPPVKAPNNKKETRFFSLYFKLVLCILLALFLSMGFCFLLQHLAGQAIHQFYKNKMLENSYTVASQLQRELNRGAIDVKKDPEQVQSWLDEVSVNQTFYLYDSEKMFAYGTSDDQLYSRFTDQQDSFRLLDDQRTLETPYGTWTLASYAFEPNRPYQLSQLAAVTLSIALFLTLILLLIRRRMKYLCLLDQEIKRMQSGDLDSSLTLTGRDELSRLAETIDQFRLTLQDRFLTEQEATKANSDLITSLSHDLRTPLAALLGYMEIICGGKCSDPEKIKRYLAISRDKAYQIKDMTDRLFEYSLVFGSEEVLPLETLDGQELIGQLLFDYILPLKEKGFHCCGPDLDTPFRVSVNVRAMRRILDNLFMNLIRYGDPEKPVCISSCLSPAEQRFTLEITNHIRPDISYEDSTGIGLKTCSRLAQRQGGSFQALTSGDDVERFSVRLTLCCELSGEAAAWESPS